MQPTIQLDAAAVSDRGLKRSSNEDSVLCDPPTGFIRCGGRHGRSRQWRGGESSRHRNRTP